MLWFAVDKFSFRGFSTRMKTEKLDLDFVRRHVTDIQEFLEICPNPTTTDIGKMLAIQAGLLQHEGLILLQESQGLEFHKRIRRLGLAVEVLGRAESAFGRADAILRRNEMLELESRQALEMLEARRIANEELLERCREEGLVVQISAKGAVKVRPPTRRELLQ